MEAMLTQDDLKAIAQLMVEKLKEQDARFDEKLKQQDIRFDEKLATQHKEIVKDVTDYVHDDLSPFLNEYDRRITRLEEHTQHPPGTPTGITPTPISSL